MTDKTELPGLPEPAAIVCLGAGERYAHDQFIEVQLQKAEGVSFPPGTTFYTADQVRQLLATRAPGAVSEALSMLVGALNADPNYAWSWHSNVAMAAFDEGLDHAAANRAASRFMHLLGCDTSKNEHYAATQATAAPKPAEPVVTDEEVEIAVQAFWGRFKGTRRMKLDRKRMRAAIAALRGEGA